MLKRKGHWGNLTACRLQRGNMISVQDARDTINAELFQPNRIYIELQRSQNYFLAEDICADRDYPPFNRAAVDGYAFRYADIEAGKKSFSVAATIFSGEGFLEKVNEGTCIKIMTGAAVPPGFDVLLKVEHCKESGGLVSIPEETLASGLNISQRGENVRQGEVIIKKGTKIDERVVHSLAAAGVIQPPVFSLPVVNIVSTGNEIIRVNEQPNEYQIRDSNYYGLLFHLAKLNIFPKMYAIIKDDEKEINTGLTEALDCDVLLISGGVSMGDRDFVPAILLELGAKNLFHKVNIKPGKPFWFGHFTRKNSNRKTFIFALPGNPFSTLVAYKVFIEPWLYGSFCNAGQRSYYMPLEREKILKGDRPEYFPAAISTKPGSASTLDALAFHGSGDVTATAGSDGLGFHPIEKRRLEKGDIVEFIPWN